MNASIGMFGHHQHHLRHCRLNGHIRQQALDTRESPQAQSGTATRVVLSIVLFKVCGTLHKCAPAKNLIASSSTQHAKAKAYCEK